jgi:peptide/nickel transport system substrate-binding protein
MVIKCSSRGTAFSMVVMGLFAISVACAPTVMPAGTSAIVHQEAVSAAARGEQTGGQAPVMVGEAGRTDKTLVIGSSEVKGFSRMNDNQNQFVEDFVHGNLFLQDDQGRWLPAIAAEAPSLQNGTWRLLDDGGSEITYKIKPGVKWHDGVEFTVHDIVFEWRMALDPDLPYQGRERAQRISNMEVLDNYTVKVTRKDQDPLADTADLRWIWPLPRHILEEDHKTFEKLAFASHPYWTTEFVGLGPYRVTRFEFGSHLTLTAFDDYVLGPPRIKNVVVQFYQDTNVLTTALLAGSVHTTLLSSGLNMNDGIFLATRWAGTNEGKVVFNPASLSLLAVQMRSEFQQPAALADVRVRRALLHAIDRQTLVNERFGGFADVADGWVSPRVPGAEFFADAITRYEFDPSRAQQLLAEAGWQRGPDGMLVDAAGRRFELEYRAQGRDAELTQAVVGDYWKRIGIDVQQEVIPSARARDNEWMARFPGVLSNKHTAGQPIGGAVNHYDCANVPAAQNRWLGQNRGGYCTPEMQQQYDAWRGSFPYDVRLAPYKEMMRIALRELPHLPLHFESEPVVVRSNLHGINAIPPQERGRTGMWAYTWTMP